MTEEKKEPWLNYLALTTVTLAVCATVGANYQGFLSVNKHCALLPKN
jgi:hypothetical protein